VQAYDYPGDAPRTIESWLEYLKQNSQAFKAARPTSYMKEEAKLEVSEEL